MNNVDCQVQAVESNDLLRVIDGHEEEETPMIENENPSTMEIEKQNEDLPTVEIEKEEVPSAMEIEKNEAPSSMEIEKDETPSIMEIEKDETPSTIEIEEKDEALSPMETEEKNEVDWVTEVEQTEHNELQDNSTTKVLRLFCSSDLRTLAISTKAPYEFSKRSDFILPT